MFEVLATTLLMRFMLGINVFKLKGMPVVAVVIGRLLVVLMVGMSEERALRERGWKEGPREQVEGGTPDRERKRGRGEEKKIDQTLNMTGRKFL